MRLLLLYDYPPQPAGLSTQGDLLFRGLREAGVDCVPAPRTGDLQKEWLYRCYKPHVAIGIGWWGYLRELVIHPRRFGVEAVPWLVADGCVANYQDDLNSLPLILTTSSWVAETYARDGISPKNIVVQPIGCDVSAFRPMPRRHPRVKAIRDALGVADDEKLILTIGGDAASKGSQEVMTALAKVNSQFPKWRYVCKVWKQERTERQNELDFSLAGQLGIREKITYLEGILSREFMPYLYNACDIYAAPSRQEGFGLPHVEAQACGKPVLSVDAMGVKETVIHGETGYLAGVAEWISITECEVDSAEGFADRRLVKFDEPKVVAVRADTDDLAEYILKLMSDDDLAARMGRAARRNVEDRFDHLDIAKSIAGLVRDRVPAARAA